MSTASVPKLVPIQKTPGVCGGEACIRDTRHTVAGLVQWRNEGLSDSQILHHLPSLDASDLAAAWEYYAQNQAEIDRAIREDEDA